MLLHFAEEVIDIDTIEKIVYLEDRGTMNNLLANTDGYNLGTGCIVKDYINPNIIFIPLKEGGLIQVGFIKQKDIVLPEALLAYTNLLTASFKKSAPNE